MRESKFRAWEKNLKEIIPVHSINFINKMINTDSAWRFFDEIELMQFTGLYDKNGKEIYEGDVHKDEENMLWEVIFDNGCFKLENTGIPGRMFITKDIEVIGNIYENPELLEN